MKLRNPVSTEELVAPDVPLRTIHKTVLTTQHTSKELPRVGGREDLGVGANHAYQKDW